MYGFIKKGSVDLGYHTRCHTRYAPGTHTRGSDTVHTRYARKGTPTAMHVGQCMPSLELSHQGRRGQPGRSRPGKLPLAHSTHIRVRHLRRAVVAARGWLEAVPLHPLRLPLVSARSREVGWHQPRRSLPHTPTQGNRQTPSHSNGAKGRTAYAPGTKRIYVVDRRPLPVESEKGALRGS